MVLMIMRAPVDAAKLEELARRDPNPFEQVKESALRVGGIRRHRIFATDSEIIVVDEWDSPEQFQRFMAESTEIAQVFADAGVTVQPQIEFARQINLGDEIG